MFLLSWKNSEKLLVPNQPAPTLLPGNLLEMYILHPTPHPLGQKLCGGGEEGEPIHLCDNKPSL